MWPERSFSPSGCWVFFDSAVSQSTVFYSIAQSLIKVSQLVQPHRGAFPVIPSCKELGTRRASHVESVITRNQSYSHSPHPPRRCNVPPWDTHSGGVRLADELVGSSAFPKLASVPVPWRSRYRVPCLVSPKRPRSSPHHFTSICHSTLTSHVLVAGGRYRPPPNIQCEGTAV